MTAGQGLKRRAAVAAGLALALILSAWGPGLAGATVEAGPGEDEKPLAGAVIVLDPGHSGGYSTKLNRLVPDGRGGRKACNNSGTATAQGYAEHTFNFDVAKRTAKLLRAKGAKVILTRQDDTKPGPCVDARGTFGQDHGADAVVSIHGDGSANTKLKGYFAIVSNPPLNEAQGAPSVALAKAIMAQLEKAGFDRNPSYRGGLSKRSDIAGVSLSKVPAVMMELGEMKNPAEARIMSSAKGRARYARAVAAGIEAWLG